MSKNRKEKERKPLKEKGLGFYEATLNFDKVVYNFHIASEGTESFSEKNILNFVALSYKHSCLKLLAQMKKYDLNKNANNYQSFTWYYLPAMFCFRHYIELQLKLLYMDWHKEEYLESHDLDTLLSDLQKKSPNSFSCFYEPIKYIKQLEQIESGTSTVEYFRYLIDTNFNCKENIEIPMFEYDKVLHYIANIETQTAIMAVNRSSTNK